MSRSRDGIVTSLVGTLDKRQREVQRFLGISTDGRADFVAGGRRLAALCSDKKFRVWESATGEIVQEIGT